MSNGVATADGAQLYGASFGEMGTPFGTDDPGYNTLSVPR